MGYLFSIATVLLIERRRSNKRRRARRWAGNTAGDEKRTAGKIKFSKLFLSAVLLTYFAGFWLGFWVVTIDPSQLGALSDSCLSKGSHGIWLGTLGRSRLLPAPGGGLFPPDMIIIIY